MKHLSGVLLKDRQAPAIIPSVWIGLPGTNCLAYLAFLKVTKIFVNTGHDRFVKQNNTELRKRPGANVIKLTPH
jgi:hypothetical protein